MSQNNETCNDHSIHVISYISIIFVENYPIGRTNDTIPTY